MRQGWTLGAWVGIIVALGMGFALILPRVKTIRAAIPESGTSLPEATLARLKDPMIPTLIRVRFMLAIGIVALMTSKPQLLSTALFVLLGAVVLGLLASVGIWTKSA